LPISFCLPNLPDEFFYLYFEFLGGKKKKGKKRKKKEVKAQETLKKTSLLVTI